MNAGYTDEKHKATLKNAQQQADQRETERIIKRGDRER